MPRKRHPAYLIYFLLWLAMFIMIMVGLGFYVSLSPVIDLALASTVATFLLFGIDKHQATIHRMRVPEKLFYLTVLLGGSAGALLGMNIFRHKTSKTSFQFVVVMLIVAQIALAYIIYHHLQ